MLFGDMRNPTRFLPSVFLLLVLLTAVACSRSAADYLAAGNRAFESGKYEDALLNYRKVLQKDARNAEAYYRLGLTEMRRNNLRGAYATLMRALELAPGNDAARIELADVCLAQFTTHPRRPAVLFEEAVKQVQHLQARAPEAFDTLRLQGQIALLNGRLDDGITLLKKAQTLQPRDRRVLLALVQALLAREETAAEGEQLALATLAQEKNFADLYDLIYARYVRGNRTAEAERILRQKVDSNPSVADYRIQLAAFYAAGRQNQEAEQTLRGLLDNPKDFPQARLLIGDMYLRLGDPAQARLHWEEGLRTDSARKLLYQKRLANLHWAEGRRPEAIRLIQEAVRENPSDDEAKRMRGSFLLAEGKREDADTIIGDYASLLKKNPADPILNYQLGRASRLKGDREGAWKYFQSAAQLNPSYLAPRLSLAELSAETNRYPDTLRYLDDILRFDKDNVGIRIARAGTLRNLGQYPEARRELERLQAAGLNSVDLDVELGLVYMMEKRFAEAERLFRKRYRPGSEDIRPTMGLAEALAAQNHYDQALEILKSEVNRFPDSAGPVFAYAEMAVRARRLDLAAGEFRKLLSTQPNHVEAVVRLGQIELAQGDVASGLDRLRKAAALAPQNVGVQLAFATALHSSGQHDEARPFYEKALQLQPQNPAVLNNYSYLCAETGRDLEKALEMARLAVQSSPDQLSYSDTLGMVYLKKNMADSALQVFRALVSKQPENPTFRLHYAMALEKTGAVAEARRELESALTGKPSKEEDRVIREMLASLTQR